jgi:hypothetical protein
MSVTYYVALPFVRTEDGVAPGEAQEMPNESAAIRRAEAMARDSSNARCACVQTLGRSGNGKFWRCHRFEDVWGGAGQVG